MTQSTKLPETSETAKELLEQVKQRGLSAYCWDGTLHFLPARLGAANHDLIERLHRQREAVRRELGKNSKSELTSANTDVQLCIMNKDVEKTLKAAIVESGLSVYRLAMDAGVNQHSIAWFVEGKRTLRLDTASKIAKRLGLELTPVEPGRKGP